MSTQNTLPRPIVYLAMTHDNRPILTTCATLNAALAQVAADLTWHILPIAFDIDGRKFDADQVLALFEPSQMRHVGE